MADLCSLITGNAVAGSDEGSSSQAKQQGTLPSSSSSIQYPPPKLPASGVVKAASTSPPPTLNLPPFMSGSRLSKLPATAPLPPKSSSGLGVLPPPGGAILSELVTANQASTVGGSGVGRSGYSATTSSTLSQPSPPPQELLAGASSTKDEFQFSPITHVTPQRKDSSSSRDVTWMFHVKLVTTLPSYGTGVVTVEAERSVEQFRQLRQLLTLEFPGAIIPAVDPSSSSSSSSVVGEVSAAASTSLNAWLGSFLATSERGGQLPEGVQVQIHTLSLFLFYLASSPLLRHSRVLHAFLTLPASAASSSASSTCWATFVATARRELEAEHAAVTFATSAMAFALRQKNLFFSFTQSFHGSKRCTASGVLQAQSWAKRAHPELSKLATRLQELFPRKVTPAAVSTHASGSSSSSSLSSGSSVDVCQACRGLTAVVEQQVTSIPAAVEATLLQALADVWFLAAFCEAVLETATLLDKLYDSKQLLKEGGGGGGTPDQTPNHRLAALEQAIHQAEGHFQQSYQRWSTQLKAPLYGRFCALFATLSTQVIPHSIPPA